MIIGMGIVYIFLILLMVLIMISSRFFKQDLTVQTGAAAVEGKKPDTDLIAVLSAAISAFRSKRRK